MARRLGNISRETIPLLILFVAQQKPSRGGLWHPILMQFYSGPLMQLLSGVDSRPTIREDAAKFSVKIGVPRREPSNRLGDGGVFLCPVVPPARQDLRSPGVEAGVHPIPIELDFVQPVGAVRCFLNELNQLRFDPDR